MNRYWKGIEMLKLRQDMDPWNCSRCNETTYLVEFVNRKSYCPGCAEMVEGEMVENEEETVETPEVISVGINI